MGELAPIKSRIKKKILIDVKFSPVNSEIDFNEKCISLVDQWHSDQKPSAPDYGIKGYLSLNEVVNFINSLDEKTPKHQAPNLLKGIYKGGTGGKFCIEGSSILFYDIDVKRKTDKHKGENTHLFDSKTNSDVFDYLEKISLFTFRSFSRNGIAGALYVPYLKNLLVDDKDLHKRIGDEICVSLTNLIYNEIKIKVHFDSKQNTFRQLRKVYPQEPIVQINKSPIQVDVKVEEEEHYTHTGIPVFHNDYGHRGTIRYQFNQDTSIEDALINNGFTKISENRWHHPASSSASTGQVNFENNTFYSHSASYGEGLYTPFDLYARSLGMNKYEFTSHLKGKYEVIQPEKDIINAAIVRLNNDNLGSQDIFDLCNPLSSLSVPEKYDFISKLQVSDLVMNHVLEYLQIVDLKIKYDYEIKINHYLSEKISEIMEYVDANSMVCIAAGTGYGKTRALIEHFKSKKNSKTIFLVPLQSIATQTSEDYTVPYLTGDSSAIIHSRVKKSNIFVATYEQGVKHITSSDFDYIIIDEFHNIYTSNNYREILTPLAYLINISNSKVIGLTGTPNNVIKDLGYKIIKCEKKNQIKREVIERFTNRNAHFIAIDHIKKHGGKSLIRINNKGVLDSIKAELVEELNYDESEILTLFSAKNIKESDGYKSLIEEGTFPKNISLVLTTGVIDEGVNIMDKDFDSVVFIEANVLNPRPEAMTQFFNRVRSHDIPTKYYFYRRYSLKHKYVYLNERNHFQDTILTLKSWKNQFVDYSTYIDVFNNDKYFLSDNTVNKPYVAYNTTLSSFERFSPYMLEEYLNNYNLILKRDNDYKLIIGDKSFKSKMDKETRQEIKHLWVNHIETVFSVLKYEANNPAIKNALQNTDYDWKKEVEDDVLNHIKVFERYFNYYERLLPLVDDPNEHIVNKNSLATYQKLNNLLYLLETMAIIKQPKSDADKANKEQIMSLINGLINKGSFTRDDIKSSLNGLNLINQPSYEVMEQILRKFCRMTYNKKTKTYKVKEKW